MTKAITRPGRWRRQPHLEYLSRRLADAAFGKILRLIVSMPPRHGKSELVSHWFPVWYLDRWPDRNVMLVSYEADFAKTWGRKVRDSIVAHRAHLRCRISDNASAAHEWQTTEGGGMLSSGGGGSLTGRGADILLVDDPIKNWEEARSATIRENAWNGLVSDAMTRLEPNGVACIVMTRWHEDDVIGRIQEGKMDGGEPWEELLLRAIAEDENDILGRKPGEALWPSKWTAEILGKKRREVGSYVWAGLYQQRPAPPEGSIFKKAWFGRRVDLCWVSQPREDGEGEDQVAYYVLRDENGTTVRTVLATSCAHFELVDLAASKKTTADYTVIGMFAMTPWRELLVVDWHREHLAGPDQPKAIKAMRANWNPAYVGIEATGYQTTLVDILSADGVPVRAIYPDKDKVTRAIPAAALHEAGMVYYLTGAPWFQGIVDECLAFPNGKNDDQVDVVSCGALQATAHAPMIMTLDPEVAAGDDPEE